MIKKIVELISGLEVSPTQAIHLLYLQLFVLDELKLLQTTSFSEVVSDEFEKETKIGNVTSYDAQRKNKLRRSQNKGFEVRNVHLRRKLVILREAEVIWANRFVPLPCLEFACWRKQHVTSLLAKL